MNNEKQIDAQVRQIIADGYPNFYRTHSWYERRQITTEIRDYVIREHYASKKPKKKQPCLMFGHNTVSK